MSYLTPAAYVQRYGRTEAVALLCADDQVLTEALLTDAIAGAWSGERTPAEQAAATAAAERLVRQLDVASRFMDGYIRAVTRLPLAETDNNVRVLGECCAALTRAGLAGDAAASTEVIERLDAQWRAWLRDVQSGRVVLDASGDAGGAGNDWSGGAGGAGGAHRVTHGQTRSAYDWTAFGAVR